MVEFALASISFRNRASMANDSGLPGIQVMQKTGPDTRDALEKKGAKVCGRECLSLHMLYMGIGYDICYFARAAIHHFEQLGRMRVLSKCTHQHNYNYCTVHIL